MGQILHGSATTTHAIRAAIQRSKAPLKELAAQHGLNHKTVAKWRKRTFVHDAPMGPKDPRSTVLSAEDEAIAVAFRKHTLLPLDDCLYALQATIPHLTRSSLHRCLKRHGISRLPEVAGDKTFKKPFKRRPIGYFHIDIAEVRTGEGKLYLFVAIDRTSKFAFAQHPQTAGFLETSLRLQNWANAWWWTQSDSNESPSQNSRKPGKKPGICGNEPGWRFGRAKTASNVGNLQANSRWIRTGNLHRLTGKMNVANREFQIANGCTFAAAFFAGDGLRSR